MPWSLLSYKYGIRTSKVGTKLCSSPHLTHFNQDPIFISILTDIMDLLTSSPVNGVNETVVKQAVPPLTNALITAKPIESWITSSAIDLLNSIVEGRAAGLAEGFFAHVAPGLFKCLGDAEDRDILQVFISFIVHCVYIRLICSRMA